MRITVTVIATIITATIGTIQSEVMPSSAMAVMTGSRSEAVNGQLDQAAVAASNNIEGGAMPLLPWFFIHDVLPDLSRRTSPLHWQDGTTENILQKIDIFSSSIHNRVNDHITISLKNFIEY